MASSTRRWGARRSEQKEKKSEKKTLHTFQGKEKKMTLGISEALAAASLDGTLEELFQELRRCGGRVVAETLKGAVEAATRKKEEGEDRGAASAAAAAAAAVAAAIPAPPSSWM